MKAPPSRSGGLQTAGDLTRRLGSRRPLAVLLLCFFSAPIALAHPAAVVLRRNEAQRLGLRTISDLRNHSELKFGLTHEFLDRRDGWQPLAAAYQLHPQSVSGIDHALGYAALRSGQIDVKDAYSTDAK